MQYVAIEPRDEVFGTQLKVNLAAQIRHADTIVPVHHAVRQRTQSQCQLRDFFDAARGQRSVHVEYKCGLMRRISVSIQASARRLISLVVRPWGSIPGPIETVTVPGRLSRM